MKKKAIILIDGSNFYFKLKDLKLNHLLNFNFSEFGIKLANKNVINMTIYYIGKIKTDGTKKTQILFDNQRKLLSHLGKHKIKYSLGYLLKSNGRYHEKGVDVNIAVDMLFATYEKLCDHIILISSDTDLLPAIKKAKEKGITVEYIGFSHQPSLAMIANCSVSKLFDKDDLLPFIK